MIFINFNILTNYLFGGAIILFLGTDIQNELSIKIILCTVLIYFLKEIENNKYEKLLVLVKYSFVFASIFNIYINFFK